MYRSGKSSSSVMMGVEIGVGEGNSSESSFESSFNSPTSGSSGVKFRLLPSKNKLPSLPLPCVCNAKLIVNYQRQKKTQNEHRRCISVSSLDSAASCSGSCLAFPLAAAFLAFGTVAFFIWRFKQLRLIRCETSLAFCWHRFIELRIS